MENLIKENTNIEVEREVGGNLSVETNGKQKNKTIFCGREEIRLGKLENAEIDSSKSSSGNWSKEELKNKVIGSPLAVDEGKKSKKRDEKERDRGT